MQYFEARAELRSGTSLSYSTTFKCVCSEKRISYEIGSKNHVLTQEILWIHAELFGPYGITFFRNATAPRLYLRYERIIVDADSYGEGALRVTRVLAQFLEPLPAFLLR